MQDLTTGREGKLIFQFAAPMLIGNIFQQLFSVVDSIIVGNFIGKEALAAVGASFPVIFMMVSLMIGLVMGTTVVISQYFGAKDFERVKRAIDTMYIYSFRCINTYYSCRNYFCLNLCYVCWAYRKRLCLRQ